MKVESLDIVDFKRVRHVRARLQERGLTLIVGENAQGKSSTIDAIEFLFRGAKALPAGAVRDGADAAKLVMELVGNSGQRYRCTRTVTAGGSEIKLDAIEDGRPKTQRAPQSFLDDILSKYALRPFAVFDQPTREARTKTVADAVGIDASVLADAVEKIARAKSLLDAANKASEAAQAKCVTLDAVSDGTVFDLDALRIEQESAWKSVRDWQQKAGEYRDAVAKIERMKDSGRTVDARIKQILAEIDTLNAERIAQAERRDEIIGEISRLTNAMGAAPDQNEHAKLEGAARGCDAKIAQATQTIAMVEGAKTAATDFATAQSYAEECALMLGAAREERRRIVSERIAAVGLSEVLDLADDGDILVYGRAAELASRSQKARAAMAITRAANPQARIILIDDADALDAASLAETVAMAHEHDFQVIAAAVWASNENAETLRVVDGVSE